MAYRNADRSPLWSDALAVPAGKSYGWTRARYERGLAPHHRRLGCHAWRSWTAWSKTSARANMRIGYVILPVPAGFPSQWRTLPALLPPAMAQARPSGDHMKTIMISILIAVNN